MQIIESLTMLFWTKKKIKEKGRARERKCTCRKSEKIGCSWMCDVQAVKCNAIHMITILSLCFTCLRLCALFLPPNFIFFNLFYRKYAWFYIYENNFKSNEHTIIMHTILFTAQAGTNSHTHTRTQTHKHKKREKRGKKMNLGNLTSKMRNIYTSPRI